MKNFGVIAKEVGICLLLLIVALGANTLLFKDLYFKTLDVPAANEYSTINRDMYKVVGDIQDAQNATQTYAASPSQMEEYLTEYRYTPGKENPFDSSSSVTDLPSETVSNKNRPSSNSTTINEPSTNEGVSNEVTTEKDTSLEKL